MQIQQIIRTDPERVLINVLNSEANSMTTGTGVCFAIGNEDVVASANGVDAVHWDTSSELLPSWIGVSKGDIAANTFGLVIAWGFADSIALSQEADVTVGLLAGASLLIPGANAGASVGAFTSVPAPQAISTFMGKYVINATTQSTNGGVNFTKGFVRCL